VSTADLSGLKVFGRDYPEARRLLIYMGEGEELREGIHIMRAPQAITSFKRLLSEGSE